jgi:hypothetical protein
VPVGLAGRLLDERLVDVGRTAQIVQLDAFAGEDDDHRPDVRHGEGFVEAFAVVDAFEQVERRSQEAAFAGQVLAVDLAQAEESVDAFGAFEAIESGTRGDGTTQVRVLEQLDGVAVTRAVAGDLLQAVDEDGEALVLEQGFRVVGAALGKRLVEQFDDAEVAIRQLGGLDPDRDDFGHFVAFERGDGGVAEVEGGLGQADGLARAADAGDDEAASGLEQVGKAFAEDDVGDVRRLAVGVQEGGAQLDGRHLGDIDEGAVLALAGEEGAQAFVVDGAQGSSGGHSIF